MVNQYEQNRRQSLLALLVLGLAVWAQGRWPIQQLMGWVPPPSATPSPRPPPPPSPPPPQPPPSTPTESVSSTSKPGQPAAPVLLPWQLPPAGWANELPDSDRTLRRPARVLTETTTNDAPGSLPGSQAAPPAPKPSRPAPPPLRPEPRVAATPIADLPVQPALDLDAAAANEASRREAVRAEFLHAWHGYERFAWGQDELRPVSQEGIDKLRIEF